MQDEIERLRLLVGAFELALGRLFETVPGGTDARERFAGDLRELVDNTKALQPDSVSVQTYEALLRRLGTAAAADLAAVPTPERGTPPVGPGA